MRVRLSPSRLLGLLLAKLGLCVAARVESVHSLPAEGVYRRRWVAFLVLPAARGLPLQLPLDGRECVGVAAREVRQLCQRRVHEL